MKHLIKITFSLCFMFSNYLIAMNNSRRNPPSPGISPETSPSIGYTSSPLSLPPSIILPLYSYDSWKENAEDIIRLLKECFVDEDKIILLNLWDNLCTLTLPTKASKTFNTEYRENINQQVYTILNSKLNNFDKQYPMATIIRNLQEFINIFLH